MAVSVRMDPVLERELEAAARRQGVTKSQFIVDAVERALGHKNPYELLLQVQEERVPYRVGEATAELSPGKKDRLRALFEEQHRERQQQWAADKAVPAAPKRAPRAKK